MTLDDSKKNGIISQIVRRITDIEEFVRKHNVQNHVSGTIVQVAYFQTGAMATGSTVIPYDNTIPQNSEGDQYMSLSITPKSALNILDIETNFTGSCSAISAIFIALFQDSIANALAAVAEVVPGAFYLFTTSFKHEMIAGTTNPITFKVRAGPGSASTLTFNGSAGASLLGGVMASSIRIIERKP